MALKQSIYFPKKDNMYKLPPLGYAYDALEPYIDARTMEIHYTKHHQTYIDNLNAALKDHPHLQALSLEELVSSIDSLPESVRTAIRNNGGGHYNHSLFWQLLDKKGGAPSGTVQAEIVKCLRVMMRLRNSFHKQQNQGLAADGHGFQLTRQER